MAKKRMKVRKKDEELPSDMEDEVDKFHKQRDKISFEASEDDSDFSGDIDGEAVYDLKYSTSDADDDGDDDNAEGSGDDDAGELEDDFLEEEIERGGRTGQLAKQAKLLRAKLRLSQAEDTDEEDEEDDDEEEKDEAAPLWGKKKKAYYDADEVDDEDEEAGKEEEAEARRLQREAAEKLRPEDFGDEQEDSEEDEEAAADVDGKIGVEQIARELDGEDQERRVAAVMSDAPELMALVDDLKDSLQQLRTRVGPLLNEVREGQLATESGVSYLEVKNLLLLQYCLHITFYLLLKAEGRPVKDHPVIMRLVQIRAFLEKIRPIDKKLSYQMDKLLSGAQAARSAQGAQEGGVDAPADADDDPLRYGPRPDELVGHVHASGSGRSTGAGVSLDGNASIGVYRPPKLNPVSMEDDVDRNPLAKEQRNMKRQRQRAARSDMIRELVEEIEDAPEEVRFSAVAGGDSAAAIRVAQRQAKIQEVEEELMTRVMLSKDERRKMKAQRRMADASGGALVDGFDDLADLVELGATIDPKKSSIDSVFQKHKLSSKFGADVTLPSKKLRSGDDDLPMREALNDRRAKFDAIRAKQSLDVNGYEDDDVPTHISHEEDEFYQAAKQLAHKKRKARRDAHTYDELAPPLPDATASGPRKISKEIEKNRGLVPHRKKDNKNPRKKQRLRFEKATMRRKGQVQAVRPGGATYGGEDTGIRAKVSKSVKF